MLTSLGKKLRILRVTNGELLKDMAEKLEMTPAYLSSIENGKRNPPKNIVENIVALYNLDTQTEKDLKDAYFLTLNEISICLENTSKQQKELGLVFARRFNSFNPEEVSKLLQTLDNLKGV